MQNGRPCRQRRFELVDFWGAMLVCKGVMQYMLGYPPVPPTTTTTVRPPAAVTVLQECNITHPPENPLEMMLVVRVPLWCVFKKAPPGFLSKWKEFPLASPSKPTREPPKQPLAGPEKRCIPRVSAG